MANPQKENGYTAIANEILERLAQVPSLGSEAFQVLMMVFRYTYGFNRKEAELAITFIEKGTGMKRSCVVRATARLVAKRLLVHTKKGLCFNKNHSEWVVAKRLLRKGGSSHRATRKVATGLPEVVATGLPKKENIKKTIKTSAPSQSDSAERAKKKLEPMDIQQFAEWCKISKQRHINIIGEWADTIRPALTNFGQWQTFIKRHLRAAMELSPFTDDQIAVGYQKILDAKDPKRGFLTDPTLETVVKYLTK